MSYIDVSFGVQIPAIVHHWLSYAERDLARFYRNYESVVTVGPDATETLVSGTVLLNGHRIRFTFEHETLGHKWLLHIHMNDQNEVVYQFSNIWGIEPWNECQTWRSLLHMTGREIVLVSRVVAAFTGQEPLRRRFLERVTEQLLEESAA
jgi:hypothetical protein